MFKFLLALMFPLFASQVLALEVITQFGVVKGDPSGATVAFKGIPFAAPPVGPLRWMPPQAPKPWTGVRHAIRYSDKCPQASIANKAIRYGSEDCLYLNVFRPQNITKLLPVMVWIHGGGNTVGSASDDILGTKLYDGEKLASQNVIVVTINYRLGALGFLAHPLLKSAEGVEGNYALLDQIAALKYVRDNIRAFGGDPSNVTVFGESAGAINTLALIASPLANGLFQRAIVQSGFLSDVSLEAGEKQGADFAKAAGCTTAECLRGLSASDVVRIFNAMNPAALQSAGATIDGVVLREGVLSAMRAGRAAHIPLLIGSNADEMRTLMDAVVPNASSISDTQITKLLSDYFGAEKAVKIEAEYRPTDFARPTFRLEEILSDALIHCPTREISRALSQFNPSVYRYVFSHTSESIYLSRYGAGHALELPYVFGNMSSLVYSKPEFVFSQDIRNWWTTFATVGDPNVLNQPTWSPVAQDAYLNLDLISEMRSNFRGSRCDFWAGL